MEAASSTPAERESRHKSHHHHKHDKKKKESRHRHTRQGSEDKTASVAEEGSAAADKAERKAATPSPVATAVAAKEGSGAEEEDWELNQRTVEQLCATYPNNMCCDCNESGTRWAAVNLGVFICIRCSGIHRALGVHVSKVKSTNMDRWTGAEVAVMAAIGNARGKALYEARLPPELRPVPSSSSSSSNSTTPGGGRGPISDAALRSFIERKYVAREFAAEDVKAVLRRVHRQTGYSRRQGHRAEHNEEVQRRAGDAEGAAKDATTSEAAEAAQPRRKVNTAEAMRAFYGVDTTASSATRGANVKAKAGATGGAKRGTTAVHGTFGVVNVAADVYEARLRDVLAAFDCQAAA